MHLSFLGRVFLCGFAVLLGHSANAQIIPAAATPPPIISPGAILGSTPNPSPLPVITPPPVPTIPPTPTVPPATPPPTPTVPPTPSETPEIRDDQIPPPPATPTVPPVSPPPTPTIPPISPPPVGTSLARPDPQRATAVVRYGQGSTVVPKNNQGRFQKVALQPNQVVTVVLNLSVDDFGKPADVQILDGGAISSDVHLPAEDKLPPTPTPYPSPTVNEPSGPDPTPEPSPMVPPLLSIPNADDLIDTGQLLTVSQAGQLIFHFKPGADIGLHRVSVVIGGVQYFFQFWRQNPSAPNNNPGMLRAY